jgi:biopolymer transport protein ExbD
MQLQAGHNKVYDDINITPMLDLAYVLLIIFIIMTTAAVQGIKVNLPKASDTPSLSKPRTVAITVTADGHIFMDAVPVTIDELAVQLRQKKAQDPQVPVVVRGDSAAQYKSVVEVLALLQQLDITQLGLVTQRLVR